MSSLKARIKVTNWCENNCWYCYVKKEKREINSDMLSTIINKLKTMYDSGKYKRIKICISGGDPFSTYKSVEAASMLKETFKDVDMFFYGEVCRTSNLDFVKKFKELGGGVLFSLNEDDPEEMAQKQREITNEGLFNILFTKKNIERLDEIIDVIRKYNLNIRCNHIYDPTNEYNLIETLDEGAIKLLNKLQESEYEFSSTISTFGCMNYQNITHSYCGYGETYFVFDIDGNVSRCHLEEPITTVYDNIEETIKIEKELPSTCKSCSVNLLCKGGCYYTNKNNLYCDSYYKIASELNKCLEKQKQKQICRDVIEGMFLIDCYNF